METFHAPIDVNHSTGNVVADYLAKNVPITEAIELFGFSRSGFFRFRRKHQIRRQTGNRVSLEDIVSAFDAERVGQTLQSNARRFVGDLSCIEAYARKLKAISSVEKEFGYSAPTFWRFRIRHRIRRLSYGRVHLDDLFTALGTER